jgi:hypothetical protein
MPGRFDLEADTAWGAGTIGDILEAFGLKSPESL